MEDQPPAMEQLLSQKGSIAMTQEEKDNNQPNRPSRLLRLLATLVILAVLPCLGLVGSSVYLRARQAGALSRWRSLGAPPGGGVDIVTGDTNVVYVRASTGSVYSCEHRATRGAQDCWDTAQEPLRIDPKAKFDKSLYEGEVELPAETVVDSLDVAVWYAEDAFETRYVLLDDGTVWKWDYDVGAYWSLLILILGPLAGLVLGIGAAVALWAPVAVQALRRRRPGQSSQGGN